MAQRQQQKQQRPRRGGGTAALLALAALVAVAALGLPSLARASAPAAFRGKRVLALIGDSGIKSSHSKFFKALGDAGLEVDVRGHKDEALKLRDYDAWLYDHLVVFAPRAGGERDRPEIWVGGLGGAVGRRGADKGGNKEATERGGGSKRC